MKKSKTIFICGTDTNVGKTLVTGALCAYLNSTGIRAGAFKPLESSCSAQAGMKRHLKRADTEFLKKMAAMPETLDEMNCYHFKAPLAPGVAAQIQNQKISFIKIKHALGKLQKKYDVVFVEGAGGLLVPVSGLKTNLDLIKTLKAPVLLVARLGLGTINHTLLTLHELQRHRIPIIGVILNEGTQERSQADRTNPQTLKKYGVRLWGIFPKTKKRDQKSLAALAGINLKMEF